MINSRILRGDITKIEEDEFGGVFGFGSLENTDFRGEKGDLTVMPQGEMESGCGGKSPTGAVAKTGNQD